MPLLATFLAQVASNVSSVLSDLGSLLTGLL
jgi:hypothetical protein